MQTINGNNQSLSFTLTPALQKALTLKDRHQFKAEMDDVAKKAMFGHLSEKVA